GVEVAVRCPARGRRPPIAGCSVSDRRPVPFRGGGFDPRPRRLLPWLVFILLIAAWQAASSARWLPPLFMPSPLAVVDAFYVLWTNGTLTQHLGPSLGPLLPRRIIAPAPPPVL